MQTIPTKQIHIDFKQKENVKSDFKVPFESEEVAHLCLRNLSMKELPANIEKAIFGRKVAVTIECFDMQILTLPANLDEQNFLLENCFDLKTIKGGNPSHPEFKGFGRFLTNGLPSLEELPEALYLSKECDKIDLYKVNPHIKIDAERLFNIKGLRQIFLDEVMVWALGGESKIKALKKSEQIVSIYKDTGCIKDRDIK